jgi:hypothetical protein
VLDVTHSGKSFMNIKKNSLTLTHHLASSLDSDIQQDLVMLYFSKAFDKVPHQRLLKKLPHYGGVALAFDFFIHDGIVSKESSVRCYAFR